MDGWTDNGQWSSTPNAHTLCEGRHKKSHFNYSHPGIPIMNVVQLPQKLLSTT